MKATGLRWARKIEQLNGVHVQNQTLQRGLLKWNTFTKIFHVASFVQLDKLIANRLNDEWKMPFAARKLHDG